MLGDFFAEPTYGGFESFHDGTGAGSGWRAYNPFEAGNYWEGPITIGADSVTIVGRGFNDTDTIEHAFNRTDEAGEVFVISGDRRIAISKTVVHAAAEHTRIEPRVWVQELAKRARPIGIFYGVSQTEKLPDTLIDYSAGKTSALRFACHFSEAPVPTSITSVAIDGSCHVSRKPHPIRSIPTSA